MPTLKLHPYDPEGDIRRRADASRAKLDNDLKLERANDEGPDLSHLPANVYRSPTFKTEAERIEAARARAKKYRLRKSRRL